MARAAAASPVKILGADQLEASLRSAAGELEDLTALNERVGEVLAAAARPRAPSASGALAASIRGYGAKDAGAVSAGSDTVPYAGVQEWGWSARNIPAQPYLTVALEESEDRVLDMYEDEADRILGDVRGVSGFGR